MKTFADRSRNAGKPHKVIIIAIAQKLITLANALSKTRQMGVIANLIDTVAREGAPFVFVLRRPRRVTARSRRTYAGQRASAPRRYAHSPASRSARHGRASREWSVRKTRGRRQRFRRCA